MPKGYYKRSEEQKRKLRKLHLGHKHSEETKKNFSKTRKGRISPMKGKVPWNKGNKFKP